MAGTFLLNASLILLFAAALLLWYRSSGFLLLHLAAFAIIPAYLTLTMLRLTGHEALRRADGTLDAFAIALLGAAIIVSASLAAALNATLFRPASGMYENRQRLLRPIGDRGQAIVGGIALNAIAGSAIAIAYGPEVHPLDRGPFFVEHSFWMLSGTAFQVATAAICIAVFACVAAVLRRSDLGLTIRAAASNPSVAANLGIRPLRVAAIGTFLGALVAGVAGALAAFDAGLVPELGIRWLLYGITAAVVAGANLEQGFYPGVAIGAILISLLIGLVGALLNPSWATAAVFVVLAVSLRLFREGIFPARGTLRRG